MAGRRGVAHIATAANARSVPDSKIRARKIKSEPEVEALAENAASGSNGMCTAERLETLRGLFKATTLIMGKIE